MSQPPSLAILRDHPPLSAQRPSGPKSFGEAPSPAHGTSPSLASESSFGDELCRAPRSPLQLHVASSTPHLAVVAPQVASHGGASIWGAPFDWPEFNARLGELTYLSAFPGDKRKDAVVDLLRAADQEVPQRRDISVISGALQQRWLMTPSHEVGALKKFRFGSGERGGVVAILCMHTSEALLNFWRSHSSAARIFGARDSRDTIAQADQERLAEVARRNTLRHMTLQHALHALVLGELVAQQHVLDLINHHGKLYAVMPLFAGRDLTRLLGLEPVLRRALGRRVLLALGKQLQVLQRRGAVHHNVCAANVLWDQNEITLSGFSRAHFVGPLGTPSDTVPTHVPPEMVLDPEASAHGSDRWGLGVTLIRLLCGPEPFLVAAESPTENTAHIMPPTVPKEMAPHFLGTYPSVWHSYAAWYAERPELAGPGLGTLGGRRPSGGGLHGPLHHQQLDRAVAHAAELDPELTHICLSYLLAPSPADRHSRDLDLVAAAAPLSQAVSTRDNDALHTAMRSRMVGPGNPPAFYRRMITISEAWRQQLAPRPQRPSL